MKRYMEITDILAREILDSRGNPTLEVEVYTEKGMGRACVPSGVSTGVYEAAEMRDGDRKRYQGKGVKTAVENVNNKLADELIGYNVFDQRRIDKRMCEIDGTPNKEILGANAILGVSLAVAQAAANSLGLPLYQYIGGTNAHMMPVPMMNILNGGAHADNNVDIQEFMIMPINASCFAAGLRMCSEVYHALKKVLNENGYITAVGDEGGFAPNLKNDEEAFEFIIQAVELAGYNMEYDFKIAIDAAASEWYQADGTYKLPKSDEIKTKNQLIEYWEGLCEKYNIYSIEDAASEDDWECWKMLTMRLGHKTQLVGDDLFTTNTERLKKGIELRVGNSILIKLNQIGTLSETLDAVEMAQKAGYTAIISHRSGETEDTIIADIAVATNSGQIKAGAPCRSERVAKYNQLLRIEQELGKCAKYGML